MAGTKIDSAGMIKLQTLDDALLLLQRVNGLVEQYGLALKNRQLATPFILNIRRTLPTLAANLKDQFGMISDQVTAVNLTVSRGASEAVRLRQLREGVSLIRQSIDIAFVQVKDRHTVSEASRG